MPSFSGKFPTMVVPVIALVIMALSVPTSVRAQDIHSIESARHNRSKQSQGKVAQTPQSSVSLTVTDSTVSYVIQELARLARLRIFFDDKNPDFTKRISVRIVEKNVMDAMAIALKRTNLMATLTSDGETIVVRPSGAATPNQQSQQQKKGIVTGRVVDSISGNGINGVTVTIAGMKIASTTDTKGGFTLRDVPLGQHDVTAKVFGYRSLSQSVNVAEQGVVNVQFRLVPLSTQLSSVVTTATGQQERIKVGNDIAKIDVAEVLRTAPVTTMSELLTNRIPGVIVQKTSGAAGAPSVIRIRGVSSIALNNDPIIIVDGVRVYSTVTDPRDSSVVPGGLAPSALDGIDPNSVETIEVMRGPSAAALYGTDAANGIIVITTKRGRSGPTRWRGSTQQGISWLPGSYPRFYQLWGRSLTGERIACKDFIEFDAFSPRCIRYDSVQSWQFLNDKRTTLFGRGALHNYAMTVDGGSPAVQYALSINTSSTLGYSKMPESEVDRLEKLTGNALPPWQRRPDGSANAGGTAKIFMQITPQSDLQLTSTISRQTTRSTPLVTAINQYFSWPSPSDSMITLNRVPHFRTRGETQRLNSLLALNSQWRLSDRLRLMGRTGWDRTNRNDQSLLRQGDCPGCPTASSSVYKDYNAGRYAGEKSTADVISADANVSVDWLRSWLVSGPMTVGLNFKQETIDRVQIVAAGLPAGGTSFVGADSVRSTGGTIDARVAGIFVDQRLSLFNRFHTGFGFRVDRGSGIGPNASAPTYPKLDFSIPVLTDENAWRWINTLRIRTAFGHSGRQPDITSRIRTFEPEITVGANEVPALDVRSIGNTRLRPERSVELEGGIDLGMWNDRLTVQFTGYRKYTRDMLIDIEIPPSVYGGKLRQQGNIGNVLNLGVNSSITARVIDNTDIFWTVTADIDANRNRLVSVNKAMKASGLGNTDAYSNSLRTRSGLNVEGYPLYGYWTRPLVSYADANDDGLLSIDEIRLSDSAVFLGAPYPKFDGSFSTGLGILQGRINLNAMFSVQHGMLQVNQAWMANDILGTTRYWKSLNDTTASLDSRARILDRSIFVGRVSSVRWDELSLSMRATPRIARMLRVNDLLVALQGRNLRLWSNYTGKDPNVRGRGEGRNSMQFGDEGQLPPPRSWLLRVELSR